MHKLLKLVLIATTVLFASATFAAADQQLASVVATPQIDLRYLQHQSDRTVAVTIDAMMAGGPAVSDPLRDAIVAQLRQGGYTVVENAQPHYIDIGVAIPQGAQPAVGYIDMKAYDHSGLNFFRNAAPASPPYALFATVTVTVKGGASGMTMVVASAPGNSPDEAMPTLQVKIAEGIGRIF